MPMIFRRFVPGILLLVAVLIGWQRLRNEPQDEPARPVRWCQVPDLPDRLAIHETVFWEPLDTESLRKLIRENPGMVAGKSVLEIGTGSGLLALCCHAAGADRVVATDINPHAIRCAQQNSQRLGATIDFRLVGSAAGADTGAFAVIGPDERFDLIISNPPWKDATPREWSEYALYDPSYRLLRSLIDGFEGHLQPEGKLLLAYGCVDAISCAQRLAAERQLIVHVLDERNPQDLPAVFLPGLLLGIRPDLSRNQH